MSISDKTKKSLEKIGLTSYEIRAYTTLIKDGESNASEISQNSGVPYSKIYEILGTCLLYTSPSPRDQRGSRMPSSA